MLTQIQEAYIVAALRTPVGKARGVFRHVRPDDLLSHVIKGALASVPTLDPRLIEDVIIGCAMPEAEQGMNVARIALLLAGLPDTVPGVTVNRFCASGLETIAIAAERIRAGNADVIIAGGTESMSMVPMGGHKLSINPALFSSHDEHMAIAYGMGLTAEKVARQWKVSREAQDNFALESHRRAISATESGYFKTEILPYEVIQSVPVLDSGDIKKQKRYIDKDEGPRAGSTPEMLAKLPAVFNAHGTVTAANASQTSDGAAAVIIVSEKALKHYQLKPVARFCSYAVAGVPPEIMGIGPKEAIPKALHRAGLQLNDIDWIELNEAFAAQSLAVMNTLALDPAKVNPQGGAIALGHPLGATGAIRTATLLHGLHRIKKRFGMVTMCIGTGMGAAGIFEKI